MPNSTPLDPTRTVHEIIVQHPETKAVFNRFGIDTCCGSAVPVSAAALREGIDVNAVLEALREAMAHV
jgi:regulator of cell morphogenesis and NO signaling